jgi:hypothetical protein
MANDGGKNDVHPIVDALRKYAEVRGARIAGMKEDTNPEGDTEKNGESNAERAWRKSLEQEIPLAVAEAIREANALRIFDRALHYVKFVYTEEGELHLFIEPLERPALVAAKLPPFGKVTTDKVSRFRDEMLKCLGWKDAVMVRISISAVLV